MDITRRDAIKTALAGAAAMGLGSLVSAVENVPSNPPQPTNKFRPLAIAHRGYSIKYPENTLLSFSKAMEHNPDSLECDIYITADGKPVISHDHTTNRMGDREGVISQMAWSELKKVDVGSKKDPKFAGERIPLFEELLDLAKGKVNLCVEIKNFSATAETVRLIQEHQMIDQVVIFAFDDPVISEVKALCPEMACLFLHAYNEERDTQINPKVLTRRVFGLGANSIGLADDNVTPETLKYYHQHHLFVAAWTIDYDVRMRELRDMGCDAIITNDIVTLQQVLNS